MSHQSDLDNHADQMNPNNDAYWDSRGYDDRPDDWEEHAPNQAMDTEKSNPDANK
jgi:hypothetical protein